MGKWRILLWVAIVVATLAFLYAVRGILLPFVLAWIIAVMLEPVVRKLRLRGYSRKFSVISISVVFFGVVIGATAFAVPRISNQVADLRLAVTNLSEGLSEERANDNLFVRWNPVVKAQPPGALGFIDRALDELRPVLERLDLPSTRTALMEQYVDPHRKDIGKSFQNFINGFLGLLAGAASQVVLLIFTPFFVLMMLMDMEQIKLRTAQWIPPAIRANTLSMMNDISGVFNRYLRGVATTVGLYTVLMVLILGILGVPYAMLLSLLAGVVYLIPYIGGWISFATVLLVTGFSGKEGNWFITMDGPWQFAIMCSVVFLVISTIFDQVVYPKLVGGAVDLHPLVSFFVIFSGGALFGLPGMIIAFPLAGSIKVTLARLLRLTNQAGVESLRLPAVPLRHRNASGV